MSPLSSFSYIGSRELDFMMSAVSKARAEQTCPDTLGKQKKEDLNGLVMRDELMWS